MGGTQDRPLRVFLSHTSELRKFAVGGSFIDAAERAVKRAGHMPMDMADWTASPNPPAHVCREAVEKADVYLGVLGFRYGSPVPERPALSYTEMEFETAQEAGKPLLVFLLDKDKTQGPLDLLVDAEHGHQQEAFRRRVGDTGITRATASNPDALAALVVQALLQIAPPAGEAVSPIGAQTFGNRGPFPDGARSKNGVVRLHGAFFDRFAHLPGIEVQPRITVQNEQQFRLKAQVDRSEVLLSLIPPMTAGLLSVDTGGLLGGDLFHGFTETRLISCRRRRPYNIKTFTYDELSRLRISKKGSNRVLVGRGFKGLELVGPRAFVSVMEALAIAFSNPANS